ncbi:MAG: AraC family transcriptional regulator [Alistipes sp.]|nr:AraC family transcriptional regulator [Alistipes sp.]
MNGMQLPDARFHYLIPNKADEMYGCTISTVGMQIVAPDEEYPAKDHPVGYMFNPERGRVLREYQLLYIVGGRGVFSNASGDYEVSKGSLILLRPGEWHTYKPIKDIGWNEYFIGFSGKMAEKSIDMMFAKNETVFNIGLNRELVDLYQHAIDVAATDRPAAQQLLCGIVMHMLGIVNFTARNESVAADRLDQIIEQAKAIMQEHVLQNIDLEELAEQLNISYSWFRKIFRDYTGHPPAKYFTLVKLRHAQYLLANTQDSIKEIAFALGFKSTEHFYTTFKRGTGSTPNIYRKLSTPDKR